MMKSFGVATKAVIINSDSRYLVLRKSDREDVNPNTYDLPGGRLEFGEKPEEGLQREIKEETGLEVEILSVLNTWSFQKDENFQLVGIDFLCKHKRGIENLSEEHMELIWMKVEEIEKSDMPSWLIKTLQKAEKLRKLLANS